MKKQLQAILASALTCAVVGVSHGQTDVASVSDQLVVAANESVRFGDVVAAGRLFPGISKSNVSYVLSENDGIHLTLLTRSPETFANRVAELEKTSNDLKIKFGLPPLSPNVFSFDKLEKYRTKNGVVVFLHADWCATSAIIGHKELQKQSLLKFLYDSNVPVLWADYTDSVDGGQQVGKFAKQLSLNTRAIAFESGLNPGN